MKCTDNPCRVRDYMRATSALAQDFSPDELASRAIERRAVEAVIWVMPAEGVAGVLRAAGA